MAQSSLERVREAAGAAGSRLRPGWQVITPAGRAALLVTVAAWLLGVELGWQGGRLRHRQAQP
jgi:hypothetical protein